MMSYHKPRIKFKGCFYGKYVLDEQGYRDKKDYALKHREKNKIDANQAKREFFEGKMIVLLHDDKKMSFPQIAKALSLPNAPVDDEIIRRRYHKARENAENILPLTPIVS